MNQIARASKLYFNHAVVAGLLVLLAACSSAPASPSGDEVLFNAGAEPTEAAGQSSHVSDEPFDPADDCPDDAESLRSEITPNSPSTSSAEAGQSETGASNPSEVLVSIYKYEPGGDGTRRHIANGVALGQQGLVATVIYYGSPVRCLEVVLQTGARHVGQIVAIDPTSGATIIGIAATDLPDHLADPPPVIDSGKPVLVYHQPQEGPVEVSEGVVSDASGSMLWVEVAGPFLFRGTAVFDSDGNLVGLAAHAPGPGARLGGRWTGAITGPTGGGGAPRPAGYYQGIGRPKPVVNARTIHELLTAVSDDNVLDTPVKVHYGGPGPTGSWRHYDGDARALAEAVGSLLRSLGDPIEIGGLGGHVFDVVGFGPGTTWLELLYLRSQRLRSEDGALLGYARYVMLWWDRGAEMPDLILAGDRLDRITHAFVGENLKDLEAFRTSAFQP